MAENITTSQCTKHVNICYHFVREFVKDGIIKTIFIKLVDNKADGFTKNVSGGTYENCHGDFIAMKSQMGIV